MKRRLLVIGLGIWGAMGAFAVGGEFSHNGCFVKWSDAELSLSNSVFSRTWVPGKGGLVTREWKTGANVFARGREKTSGAKFKVTARAARFSPAGAEGICVEVSIGGQTTRLWLFPNVPGTIRDTAAWGHVALPGGQGAAAPTGVELADLGRGGVSPPPAAASADHLAFTAPHLLLTEWSLRDRTDSRSELVFTREWQLLPPERRIELTASVAEFRDPLTERGAVLVRLAPCVESRVTQAVDFSVDASRRDVWVHSTGYPVAELLYAGGSFGRIRALQDLQRALRVFRPGRDGRFITNTWGDRNRDARIREDFLLKEVEAGAALGADGLQIDDGWQKGRTANSAKKGREKGVWSGYWAVDAQFWAPDPERLPNGLEPIAKVLQKHGMDFGLWFGPDSSNDAANWQRDADQVLAHWRNSGVRYVKLDSMKTTTPVARTNQRRFFDRVLEESKAEIVFDIDVTAEVRPGYFGAADLGPVYVENRYTDFHRYWPHQTLRTLWTLAQVVDPVRLRMELLNPRRNQDKYRDDPLAPGRYPEPTLYAMVMASSPLGFFEAQNLHPETVKAWQGLVKTWKGVRDDFFAGWVLPVGVCPDGVAWTGFVSQRRDGKGGFALIFRELNQESKFELDLSPLGLAGARQVRPIAGDGKAAIANGKLRIEIAKPLGFTLVAVEP